MDIRPAKPADRPAIRDVTRRSLEASYSLDAGAITESVENWYSEDRLTDIIEDEDSLLLVAEADGQVVGFSESEHAGTEEATLLWLHVDPAYRGEGIGSTLFGRTEEKLQEKGAQHLRARVLADNEDGNAFYRDRGFQKVSTNTVEIDGTDYEENIYVESELAEMEAIELDDGTTVYLGRDQAETGSLAPFNVVYEDPDGEERYGYYCRNCGSLASAMDAMGRVECSDCGNVRKPTRWDAAYL